MRAHTSLATKPDSRPFRLRRGGAAAFGFAGLRPRRADGRRASANVGILYS